MSEFKPIEPLVSRYAKPRILPPKGRHPRLFFLAEDLPRIRQNLTHKDHAAAYERYREVISQGFAFGDRFEFSEDELTRVRYKALAYPLLGDESAAREAIEAIFFMLSHLSISPRGDICRAYGLVMFTAASVYDWAYPLMDDAERNELVWLCETVLGPNFEVGFPPSKQGMLTGHGCEAQLLRDWLSLGIASYDEYPDIYDFVMGRIENEMLPAHNYYYQSGSHWQGSAYGPSRYVSTVIAEALIFGMSGGKERLFDPMMGEVSLTFLYYLRADGEPFRIGDDWADRGKAYHIGDYYTTAFYVANIYRKPILRAFAFEKSMIPTDDAALILILDDPSVGFASRISLPPLRYNGSPLGSYIAHDRSGASVYFKVGESYSANHEHKDSGAFMLFYKGSLASAANCYQYRTASNEKFFYGSTLDLQYNKQTVSNNCMLVYDPEENVVPRWGNSGGQRADDLSNGEYFDLNDWKRTPTFTWAKVLAHADGLREDGSFGFCLLSGDHTNAYSDKVRDYRRTSLAVSCDSPDYPMLLFVFDRLVTRDASLEKTWQMHTMGKYELDGRRAITRHPDGGVLVCDSLLPKAAELGVIGNAEERFIVRGKNLAEKCDPTRQPIREDGRGRLTVTPSDESELNYFLSAMYVTDDGKPTEQKAELTQGVGFVGAFLFDVCAVFPTGTEDLTSLAIALPSERKTTLYATGLAKGLWSDGDRVYEVGESEKSLVLTAYGPVKLEKID